jgi:MFS family permease
MYLIVSLFFLADGGEMIVLSLILTKLSNTWNLSSSQKGFLGSSVFIGIFFGALLCGKFSDVKGRKPVFVIGSIIITIFAFFSALVNDYFSFLICRGICGLGIGLSMPSAFSLATEITPNKFRHISAIMIWLFFPFGEIFIVCLSKLLLPYESGWRFILAFASFPCFLALILSIKIYESPKFLLTIGKYEEGYKCLQDVINASEINLKINDNIKNKLKEEFERNNKLFNNEEECDKNLNKNSPSKNEAINFNNSNIYEFDVNYEKTKNIYEKSRLNHYHELFSEEEEKEATCKAKINNIKIDFIKKDFEDNKRVEVVSPKKKLSFESYIEKKDFLNTNKKAIEDNELGLMKNIRDIPCEEVVKPVVKFEELLNKRYKLVTILIWFIFICSALVYYGMIYILPQILERVEIEALLSEKTIYNNSLIDNSKINNISEESEDMSYANFIELIFSAFLEIPSMAFASYLASYGRIRTMALGFLVSFVFAFISILSKSWFSFSIAVMKFFICIPDVVIMLYVCEAYPTKIRSLGVGVANSFYRIGGMLTPFLNQILFDFHYTAPFYLFTIGSLVGFIVTIMLPFETANRNIR